MDSWLVSHATAGGGGMSGSGSCGGNVGGTGTGVGGTGGAIAGSGGTSCGSGSGCVGSNFTGVGNAVGGGCGGNEMSSPSHGCSQNCPSRSGSGATTPVRYTLFCFVIFHSCFFAVGKIIDF